jgi:hypothetical protein
MPLLALVFLLMRRGHVETPLSDTFAGMASDRAAHKVRPGWDLEGRSAAGGVHRGRGSDDRGGVVGDAVADRAEVLDAHGNSDSLVFGVTAERRRCRSS